MKYYFKKQFIVMILLISLISGMTGSLSTYFLLNQNSSNASQQTSLTKPSNIQVKSVDAENLVSVIKDSVVEITTKSQSYYGPFQQPYTSEGAGSGVIIKDDGSIITNYHVIEGASSISVRLTDGSSYDAKLVASDESLDLALLKINTDEKLTVASLGSSNDLKVGEYVLAIGNPLGTLGGTVTEGILSALDREINISGVSMNLLQTSAAINAGNSGGGLFDSQGLLIGIVNAKSSGLAIEGLGFAIPIDTVKTFLGEYHILDDISNL